MNFAKAYAQIIREKEGEAPFLKKLLDFMRAKGHLSLVPEIVRILEREPDTKNVTKVVLARESDKKKFSHAIKEAVSEIGSGETEEVTDPKIVGGYIVRGGGKVLDRSFRKALVDIYQKTI